MGTVRAVVFESVGDSVRKKKPPKPHISDPPFFKFENFSVRNSVSKYRRKISVGIYRLNYGRKSFRRFLPIELRTESGRR